MAASGLLLSLAARWQPANAAFVASAAAQACLHPLSVTLMHAAQELQLALSGLQIAALPMLADQRAAVPPDHRAPPPDRVQAPRCEGARE
jgi:hypothetical protein